MVMLGDSCGALGAPFGTFRAPGQDLGSTWGLPGVYLGFCWGFAGVLLGFCWGVRSFDKCSMNRGRVMGKFWDIATCLNCGERRRVYRREWIRAARPRCLACGGPVEPSKPAKSQHLDQDDVGRTLQKKKGEGGKGYVIT